MCMKLLIPQRPKLSFHCTGESGPEDLILIWELLPVLPRITMSYFMLIGRLFIQRCCTALRLCGVLRKFGGIHNNAWRPIISEQSVQF